MVVFTYNSHFLIYLLLVFGKDKAFNQNIIRISKCKESSNCTDGAERKRECYSLDSAKKDYDDNVTGIIHISDQKMDLILLLHLRERKFLQSPQEARGIGMFSIGTQGDVVNGTTQIRNTASIRQHTFIILTQCKYTV